MRIRIIDAFTDRPFSGNPAAVCLLDGPHWPHPEQMRRIAAEMNLSETAFAVPLLAGGEADWGLRWFTPVEEVNLCGHGTLATVHALQGDGLLGEGWVRFDTRGGLLRALAEADGTITLDFPANPHLPVDTLPGVEEALGRPVLAAYETGALADYLVLLPDEHAVRALAPDFGALTRLPVRGVLATAPADDPAAGYDFVSRFFAPAVGITEDPVTGSAHTALAPYWAERLGRTKVTGYQASVRGGLVRCEVTGDRVLLAGRAVTVLDGTLRTLPQV
ncbi:PhzF family phenazine biosynthesis protein [Kitasatospora sp. NPDC088346]|uniref:PhzF family phenazine biosynthesis protein n=1 Tax=Kitasatospora sp. NPDC088346 TaxID=3364073 RepID=UPI0037F801DE